MAALLYRDRNVKRDARLKDGAHPSCRDSSLYLSRRHRSKLLPESLKSFTQLACHSLWQRCTPSQLQEVREAHLGQGFTQVLQLLQVHATWLRCSQLRELCFNQAQDGRSRLCNATCLRACVQTWKDGGQQGRWWELLHEGSLQLVELWLDVVLHVAIAAAVSLCAAPCAVVHAGSATQLGVADAAAARPVQTRRREEFFSGLLTFDFAVLYDDGLCRHLRLLLHHLGAIGSSVHRARRRSSLIWQAVDILTLLRLAHMCLDVGVEGGG
mmetsp:Transcript_107310/g.256231  ORF Transcript_107310/g.256231 Transcript_107310/m.256231 type:complete len:269 (+) Transcript_107310:136-942(+)